MRFIKPGLAICCLVFSLCSCDDESCTTCPTIQDPAPTGWFVQPTPTQAYLGNVHAFDAQTVVAIGDTIIRTTDGGATWAHVSSGTPDYLRRLIFVDANTGWAVGDNSVVLKTTDGGITWLPLSPPIAAGTSLRSVFFVDENTGWISGGPIGGEIGDAVLAKTVDGGATWDVEITSFTVRIMYFVDADSGCVSGGANLQRTTDGGATWTPRDASPANWIGDLFFVDTLHGWVAGGAGFLAVTRDGGDTWEGLNSGTTRNITETFFLDVNQGWYTARNPGVIGTTSDGGVTWRFQTLPSESNPNDIAFVDENTGWIVGVDGLILKTVTGGF